MGWENRSGRQYYYRKHRRGRHVYSEYIGIGPRAEIAASYDSDKRLRKHIRKKKIRSLKERNKDVDREIMEFEILLELMINATLLISGFNFHNGDWR